MLPRMATPQTNEALRLLIDERDRIDRAIALLQGEAQAPRRGRPPGKSSKKKAAKKRKGRPPMSEAEKQAASERMKKYWAKRRREAKKAKKAAKKPE